MTTKVTIVHNILPQQHYANGQLTVEYKNLYNIHGLHINVLQKTKISFTQIHSYVLREWWDLWFSSILRSLAVRIQTSKLCTAIIRCTVAAWLTFSICIQNQSFHLLLGHMITLHPLIIYPHNIYGSHVTCTLLTFYKYLHSAWSRFIQISIIILYVNHCIPSDSSRHVNQQWPFQKVGRTVISTHNTAHLLINNLFSLFSHNVLNTNCNNSHQTKEQTF